MHGNSALLGMSGFEAYAKSTAHRPAQFTFVSNGLSLQVSNSLYRTPLTILAPRFPRKSLSAKLRAYLGIQITTHDAK